MESPARSSAVQPEPDPGLEHRLASACGTANVYAYTSVGSTMELAHLVAAEHAPAGTLVWAAQQHHGRGRAGRTWESPLGGAYFSLIVRPEKAPAQIPQLSLVAGLAVVEAIHALTPLFASIRWPNDVLIRDRKVCGILLEARGAVPRAEIPSQAQGPSRGTEAKAGWAVVGVGINIVTDQSLLPDTATSLVAELSRSDSHFAVDPVALTGAIYQRFTAWYAVWTLNRFEPIHQALRPWIGLFGQMVHITAGTERFEGTATDLDEQGRLLVRLDSGLIRPFDMGEVTLLR